MDTTKILNPFQGDFIARLGSESAIKIRACELLKVILSLSMEIRTFKARSRVSKQPVGLDEMLKGALNRAIEALAADPEAWVVIVIENGKEEILGFPYDTPLVYVQCRNQLSMEAWGLPFPIPLRLWDRVVANKSEIGDEIPGDNHDPMGYFTRGQMDRATICAWALVMAFLPLIYWQRYAGPVEVVRNPQLVKAFREQAIFRPPDYVKRFADVASGSLSHIKNWATNNALYRRKIDANVLPFEIKPLYGGQPVGYGSIYEEALHRATSAFMAYVSNNGKNPMFATGIQTGIVLRREVPYEISCAVVIDKAGYMTKAWSMPIRLPHWMYQELLDGKSLKDGSAWEVGRRIGELDPMCEHNTLLYLSEGDIKQPNGRPIERYFVLEQVLNLCFLLHQNRDLYESF